MSGPAPLSHLHADGLAVVRRRPEDVDPERPAVVLVHGAMDRAASFGRTMRRLGDLDVSAYDRRGYAGSVDAGVASSIAEHAQDLARVIDLLGVPRVVVVGHSLGGTVAAQLSASGDERLVALAAFESPFPVLDDSFAEVGGGAVQVAEQDGPEAGAEHFYRLMVGDGTWARLRDRDRQARRAEGPALVAELVDLRRRDRALDPAVVTTPTLVGRGGVSSARMRGGAAALERRLPSARLADIDAAGHGAHLTHPDEFARYVRAAVALGDPTASLR